MILIIIFCFYCSLFLVLYSCFKWPLGEGSDQNAHAYFKSDSSQQSLITLVHLVTKLLNTSTTTGLFNFSSTGVSAFATTNAAVFTPTGQVGAAMISTTELLKQLAPVTAKYNETVVKLRTELTYVLHLALEWLTQDYSKVQNGPYIQQFLVTMIKHRLTLPMSGNDAVFGGTAEADALGTADLILKHIKCMIYNTAGRCNATVLLLTNEQKQTAFIAPALISGNIYDPIINCIFTQSLYCMVFFYPFIL